MNMELQECKVSIIKEMIRLIFSNFKTKKSQYKIPRKTIQKILFNMGKSLPENSPVKSTIPFYWFLAGPFSETIAHTIERMKEEKILLLDGGKYELYAYNSNFQHNRFVDHQENNFGEIRDGIYSEVDNTDGFSNLQLVREIYNDSPILFYPNYKTEFLAHFESYCDHHIANYSADNRFNEAILISELERAVLSIPPTPTFSNFKTLFLKFEDIIKKTFEFKSKKSREYVIVLENLKKLSNEIWTTFAYGARILEHDSYYQDQVPDWENKFLTKIETLNDSILATIEIVENNLEIQINSNYTYDKSPEDLKFRVMLAKSIGMDDLPEYDSHAFDRITGIAFPQIKDKKFDSVEVIRDIRNG